MAFQKNCSLSELWFLASLSLMLGEFTLTVTIWNKPTGFFVWICSMLFAKLLLQTSPKVWWFLGKCRCPSVISVVSKCTKKINTRYLQQHWWVVSGDSPMERAISKRPWRVYRSMQRKWPQTSHQRKHSWKILGVVSRFIESKHPSVCLACIYLCINLSISCKSPLICVCVIFSIRPPLYLSIQLIMYFCTHVPGHRPSDFIMTAISFDITSCHDWRNVIQCNSTINLLIFEYFGCVQQVQTYSTTNMRTYPVEYTPYRP